MYRDFYRQGAALGSWTQPRSPVQTIDTSSSRKKKKTDSPSQGIAKTEDPRPASKTLLESIEERKKLPKLVQNLRTRLRQSTGSSNNRDSRESHASSTPFLSPANSDDSVGPLASSASFFSQAQAHSGGASFVSQANSDDSAAPFFSPANSDSGSFVLRPSPSTPSSFGPSTKGKGKGKNQDPPASGLPIKGNGKGKNEAPLKQLVDDLRDRVATIEAIMQASRLGTDVTSTGGQKLDPSILKRADITNEEIGFKLKEQKLDSLSADERKDFRIKYDAFKIAHPYVSPERFPGLKVKKWDRVVTKYG